jgi:hypothetical protein
MNMVALASLAAVFILGSQIGTSLAGDTCHSRAVGTDGTPLIGAALTSFMTQCLKDACEAKAIDKNGNKLTGAVKESFMKRCQGRG